MVFSSHLFLFYFLPAVLLLYYAMPSRRWRNSILALASYGFYGWANPPWALIMFASTFVDYLCGIVLLRQARLTRQADGDWTAIGPQVMRTPAMRAVVIASIAANLALLGFFKYYNFTEENLNRVALALGGREWVPVLNVLLPVGISFYTFQSMSYCIDVYRGRVAPTTSLWDFCCFEAMFPQLVAGPIVRYGDIAAQLRERTHTSEKFARGVAFLALGLAKKVLIANTLAHLADAAFDAAPGARNVLDAWTGLFAYALQIYFDFSGYSDMAVGLGLMLGFVLIQNFDSPYRAESITDFWRRWHISLSTWLRDYLYIPLGGNRLGESRTYLNLMVVMLLGGFWHGASWVFVIWGAWHGALLALERMRGKTSIYQRLPRAIRVGLTFLLVSIGWVFFRCGTLGEAVAYLGSLVGVGSSPNANLLPGVMYSRYHLLVFAVAAVLIWSAPQTWQFTRRLTPLRAATCLTLLAIATLAMWTQTESPFLYFQF